MLRSLALTALACAARAQQPFTPPNSPPLQSEVVPAPVSVRAGTVPAALSPSFAFSCTSAVAGSGGVCPSVIARAFARYASLIFFAGPPDPVAGQNVITGLQVNVNADVPLALYVNESYSLSVPSSGVATLNAPNAWAALRGLETFSQLCIWQGTDAPTNSYFVTNTPVTIDDFPRFPWRGYLIDTSFNFVSKTMIKEQLDAMSYAKLNVLHWHATDDPSWPIESSSFPSFSANGAYSSRAVYSIADQQDIQQYAEDRGILVLLELDMPGHAEIWKAGDPSYVIACEGHQTLLNPIDSSGIYDVIRTLIVEYTTRFPGMPFIHLGGDEVRELTCWNESADVRAFMAANNISDVNALRNYFQLRVQDVAKSVGLDAIMWEEVLRGGYQFRNTSVVTPWISPNVTRDAVNMGLRVINYFSYYVDQQVPPGMDPPAPQGPVSYYFMDTWQTFYSYDPVNSTGIADVNASAVLGGTASCWGENADSSANLAWPRAAATAERLWSPAIAWDPDTTEARLDHFRCHLVQRGLRANPFGIAGDYGFCWTPLFAAQPSPGPSSSSAGSVSSSAAIGIAIGSLAAGAMLAMALMGYLQRSVERTSRSSYAPLAGSMT